MLASSRAILACKTRCAPQCHACEPSRTTAKASLKKKYSSTELMAMEKKYSAENYKPIPVVFATAKGAVVTDPEGKKYTDFLAAYSAVNQGHCHPRIRKAAEMQMGRCTLSARAFYNDRFPVFSKYVTEFFGYDKVLPMNTGAEAVETAIKLCRKWAYKRGGAKSHPSDGVILVGSDNFHGRTTTIVSFSDDSEAKDYYGPFTPGFVTIPYGDSAALEAAAAKYEGRLCGIMLEPIQGEAGVIVPPEGYLKKAQEVAHKYGGLFIADEVQTGIARTGKLLAHYYDGIKPDIVVLGKALSGGFHPVSAVLADSNVMDVITPGTHGSTFGGNPLGVVVAMESLQVVADERLTEKSYELGQYFRDSLAVLTDYDEVTEVRGRGLLNAVEFRKDLSKVAYDVTIKMRDHGVLAKPTHGNIIRFSPPLCVSKSQMKNAVNVIKKSFAEVLTQAK
eukprot:TRINITY_DN21021_c0_g1_i1.p2 TRINITY_DN21021_c0_g1~~TRINITY_DN21021_c0_g1_i1.p2  ORF type:complete len:449 (+),score=117.82 TRINITY_DN21021_c0_g1_i1:220-1566(+)